MHEVSRSSFPSPGRISNTKDYNLPRSVCETLSQAREKLQSSISRGQRQEYMHDRLADPDFERISNIYENYVKTPVRNTSKEKPPKTNLVQNPGRPSSAPLSRKKSREQLLKEKEDKELEECTFKPQINSKSSRRPSIDRIHMLARPKTDVFERREREKRIREETEKCTFRPNINSNVETSRSVSDCPVEDRLYYEGEQRSIERERYRRDLLEAEASLYPFRPQVQASLKKLVGTQKDKPPIYQRVNQVQQERYENRERLREENMKSPSFRPKINEKSCKLAAARKNKQETTSASISREPSQASPVLYTPTVSVQSTNEFLERQKKMQERLQAKRRELMDRIHQHSFRPNIDKTSQYIAAADTSRSCESFKEKVNRWSGEESRIRQEKLTQRQEIHNSKYNFEPKINSLSRQLGRTSSYKDLARNEEMSKKRRLKAEEKIEHIEKSCSFAPSLIQNKKYSHLTSDYSQKNDILASIENTQIRKEREIEKRKQEKDFENMRGCTFKPEIAENKPKTDREISVKGFDRFMELRMMAEKKKIDQRTREEKVFKENSQFVPPFPHTNPQPFNICPSKKAEKVKRIKEQLVEEEKNSCTFKPRISEL